MERVALLMSFLLFSFCTVSKEGPAGIEQTANKESKVQFEGFYSFCDTVGQICSCPKSRYSYYTEHQLIFFDNGKVCDIRMNLIDSLQVIEDYRNIITRKFHVYSEGTYEVIGNVITATISTAYPGAGGRLKFISTNYKGTISNENCITDWRAVEPYPAFFSERVPKRENHYFKYTLTPKSFIYKPFPAVSILKEFHKVKM